MAIDFIDVLKLSNMSTPKVLPIVSSRDNGKMLKVVDGKWQIRQDYSTFVFDATVDLSISLRFTQSDVRAVKVDWGDGTSNTYSDLQPVASHTYLSTGQYTVTIGCIEFGTTWSPGDSISSFVAQGELTSCILGNDIQVINDRTFYDCSSLTSITIPNSVTSIGSLAFYRCSGLMTITIPSNVTTISKSTFNRCTSLTSATIPDSVTSIENSAFENCIRLTSITIPDSVMSIGGYAFFACSRLTNLTVLSTAPPNIYNTTFIGVPATCPIYVPAPSVTAYKTASEWSERAAYIQAIPD